MPEELDNIKKILCCNGFVIQKVVDSGTSATLAADYNLAAQSLVNLVAGKVGEPIPFPTNEGIDQGVLLASGSISDAMGRLAGANGKFKNDEQSAVDNYAQAADALVHG